MRKYRIDIGDETYEEQTNDFSTALARAMRKYEKKLKKAGVRNKVGRWFRVDIERTE